MLQRLTLDLTKDEREILDYTIGIMSGLSGAPGVDPDRAERLGGRVAADPPDPALRSLAAKISAASQRAQVAGIPVLWFGASGMGPDEFALELRDFPAEKEGAIPASLAIRVRSAGFVIGGAPLIDGGFMLHHESVRELHHQLGAWLAASAPLQSMAASETAPTAGPEEP